MVVLSQVSPGPYIAAISPYNQFAGDKHSPFEHLYVVPAYTDMTGFTEYWQFSWSAGRSSLNLFKLIYINTPAADLVGYHSTTPRLILSVVVPASTTNYLLP
jgi:hypothetical protein